MLSGLPVSSNLQNVLRERQLQEAKNRKIVADAIRKVNTIRPRTRRSPSYFGKIEKRQTIESKPESISREFDSDGLPPRPSGSPETVSASGEIGDLRVNVAVPHHPPVRTQAVSCSSPLTPTPAISALTTSVVSSSVLTHQRIHADLSENENIMKESPRNRPLNAATVKKLPSGSFSSDTIANNEKVEKEGLNVALVTPAETEVGNEKNLLRQSHVTPDRESLDPFSTSLGARNALMSDLRSRIGAPEPKIEITNETCSTKNDNNEREALPSSSSNTQPLSTKAPQGPQALNYDTVTRPSKNLKDPSISSQSDSFPSDASNSKDIERSVRGSIVPVPVNSLWANLPAKRSSDSIDAASSSAGPVPSVRTIRNAELRASALSERTTHRKIAKEEEVVDRKSRFSADESAFATDRENPDTGLLVRDRLSPIPFESKLVVDVKKRVMGSKSIKHASLFEDDDDDDFRL